jgi:putative ABC transport system permease protein
MILDANLEDFQSLISFLESEWKEVIQETPFSYFVLDDHLMKQYEGDFNTFNLIKYFALISIIISVLGLYAMSMFLAERRFKEIGIRKAFGAEVKNIIVMVSGDLSKLIVIAYLISIPVSIFAMNKWLDSFAFKITQGIDIYIISGLITLFIGWLTISYQSFRAARTNPVNVLREE